MVAFRKLNEIEVKDKKILLRVDLNVPIHEGIISDSHRIEKIIPTVNNILERGGYPILISHFGRPKGKFNSAMSLAPIAATISASMEKPVHFVNQLFCYFEELTNP